jgi:hypothetical protein
MASSSSFFGGNPTPVELADLDALVGQVEANAALVAEGVADASQAALEAAGHASNAAASSSAAGASRVAAEAAAGDADSDRDAAQTARTGAETARAGAETAKAASEGARDTTLAYQNTTLTYRNDAQGFRNEAEGFKNSAAASANAAATFNPANFYTKTEADALLNFKAPLASPAFTGTATFAARPTFAGKVPWDASNLPTTTHGRSLANAADAKASRVLIGADRNYSGAITATNNMTFSNAESGLFYNMSLTGGVQIVNLPSTTGLPDGFSVVARATGLPSGYQTAYVAAEVGKTITYRDFASRFFYLIGKGETFRFTWIAGLNLWLSECLVQPGRVEFSRGHSTAAYTPAPTSWTALPFNTSSGETAPFSLGAFAQIPIIGTFDASFRVYYFAPTAAGEGYLTSGARNGSGIDTAFSYSSNTFAPGYTGFVSIGWSAVYHAGEYCGASILASTSTLSYYISNSYGNIRLVSR